MYTKEEIWAAFEKEIRIIKHLFEKIPAGAEHHKPTERQRSTLELLHYLSEMGAISMRATLEDNVKVFEQLREPKEATTLENFIDRMNKEETEMKELFQKFTDEELNTVISRFGTTQRKGLFLLDLLKNLTAYKMQLFLYIKQSGNHSIGTSNVWGGIDMVQL